MKNCKKIYRYVSITSILVLIIVGNLYSNGTWNFQDYDSLSINEFNSSTLANKQVDFGNIDYKLMGAAIFYATNEIRKQNGLPQFKFSTPLFKAALMHTKDMVDHGFMGHTSPLPGKSHVKDRIKMFHSKGVSWYGENVAFISGYSGTYLDLGRFFVRNWMSSPGHRANILRDRFNYLGAAGYYNSSTGAFLATQVFAGRIR